MTPEEQNLRRLAALLAGRQPIPAELADWWLAGINAFLHHQGDKSLCCALGIRGPGKRTLRTADQLRRRNASLYHASRYAAAADVGDWERANRLALQIAAWPRRWQRLQQPI